MNRHSLADILRFLLGILLIQAATGIVVYAALKVENPEVWGLLGGLSLLFGVLAAFWFASSLQHARKDAVVRVKDNHSREREKIKLRAEREKAKLLKQNQQQLLKDRDRTQSKANLKVGLSFAGMLGLGGLMLFTQFVTMGMMLMTATGGALAGYAYRTRQDYRYRKKLRQETRTQNGPKLPARSQIKRLSAEKVIPIDRRGEAS